jgi:putative radical SAM enzyme (TIGR03279 family)
MPAKISGVLEGSIAEELELVEGDILLSIDGEKPQDMIDYNYLCKNELITVEIQKANGEIEEIELEKDFDEDLGIIFESAVFDKVKPCLNNCIFCFVAQQPNGLRDTLYVKDDDYRLSYMQGTYITTTNLTEKDKERIAKLHLGPFYISVHTTNPELRVKMLRNPNAGKIMENLGWFSENEIPFHAQIVLCPEYNDGAELERTLKDLTQFGDSLLSIAIVPVGVTQFRTSELKTVDKKIALETIEISKKYPKACCSDEFFLLANKKIPDSDYYGNFSQLEDGVGALRTIMDDFDTYDLPKKINTPLRLAFACSVAAKSAFEYISAKLNKIQNLNTTVNPVISTYWGENITVAGLITSEDLIAAVKDVKADYVIVPSIMLKPFSDLFLDGNSMAYVIDKTGKKFFITRENYSVCEVIDLINTHKK